MSAPAANKVVNVDLETLLGRGAAARARAENRISVAMRRHGLRVHVIVLCHGHDPIRFATTIRLCRALAVLRETFAGVELAVSYQGGPAPAALTAPLDVPVLGPHRTLARAGGGAPLPDVGKGEHLLSCLALLRADQSGDGERRFVVFVDSDYLVYDPENVLALFAPWALGFSAPGVPCADERFAGVRFAKGGSLRLAVDTDLAKAARDPEMERTWGFADLLDAAWARHLPSAPRVAERLPAGCAPTRTALHEALGPAGFAELEAAVEQVTKHGGRSSRALSLWLASRRDHLAEHWLGRFSFLLHGDQGATLAAWSAMELAPGYGLEISFLMNALFRPGLNGRIAQALALPHAHLPKDEADNFALGVELFTLLQHLVRGTTSPGPAPGPGPEERWPYQAATKLGYKPVALTAVPQVPALYPPVTELVALGGTP
ncbi:hypothetical protein [Streptomyces sp. NPDC001889]